MTALKIYTTFLLNISKKIEDEILVFQQNCELIEKKLELYRYQMTLDNDALFTDFSKRYKQNNMDC